MVRSLRHKAVTGLAVIAASMPLLAACNTAQAPTDPVQGVEYEHPDGSWGDMPDGGLVTRTPKWMDGKVHVRGLNDAPTAGSDTQVSEVADGEYAISFTGAETPRTIADLNGAPLVVNQVASGRVDAGNGEFYTPVAIGVDPNATGSAFTPAELETLVSDTIGGTEFAGENRFYGVMSKGSSGAYDSFFSYGAIAGPNAVQQMFDDLAACATAQIGYVQVRVLPGQFSGQDATFGAIVEAYSKGGECLAQALVGDSPDLAPIASRASDLANRFAPDAAAKVYATKP